MSVPALLKSPGPACKSAFHDAASVLESLKLSMIREMETVVLLHDVPQHDLKSGDVGAVVHGYGDGKAFEAELSPPKEEPTPELARWGRARAGREREDDGSAKCFSKVSNFEQTQRR